MLYKDNIKNLLETRKVIEGSCWLYTGYRNEKGYGWVYIGDTRYLVHRLSLYANTEDFDIEDQNQKALHVLECRNRHCFNPEHLYKGTQKENGEDRSKFTNSQPNFRCGHPRIESNMKKNGKTFSCRECHRKSSHQNKGIKLSRELDKILGL